jgi:predicted nucleotidyltransferase
MNSQDAIAILQKNADVLRARGVRHAALFGSLARGNTRPDSDVDVLIELASDNTLDLFAYSGLMSYIESLFPVPVDVVDRDALKPYVRGSALVDAIRAF